MAVLALFLIAGIFIWIAVKVSAWRDNGSRSRQYGSRSQQYESHSQQYESHPKEAKPADALLQSVYYARYRMVFDAIYRAGRQEQYKIDFLLWSLRNGRELEGGMYVSDSLKKELPYYCETEREYDRFKEANRLHPTVSEMVGWASMYRNGNRVSKHPLKEKYWRDKVIDLAAQGDPQAQAALCSKSWFMSEEEHVVYRERYETRLRQLVDEGNAQAQLAMGVFLSENEAEQKQWFQKAAQQGPGDAWYELWNMHLLSASQNGALFNDRGWQEQYANYLQKGVAANNGKQLGKLQRTLAHLYADGKYSIVQDRSKAQQLYRQAAANGDVAAKQYLS